jgi:hypothetical protein
VKAEQLQVEPDAGGLSLRVWLDTLGLSSGHAAAFDTRFNLQLTSWIDTITLCPVRRSGRPVP